MRDIEVRSRCSQSTTEEIEMASPNKKANKPYKYIVEHTLFASIKIIFRYLMAEFKKKPKLFMIGFGTILIVVTFLTAIKSGIESVPLAFLKIAEEQAGETDLIIVPAKTTIYNPTNAVL